MAASSGIASNEFKRYFMPQQGVYLSLFCGSTEWKDRVLTACLAGMYWELYWKHIPNYFYTSESCATIYSLSSSKCVWPSVVKLYQHEMNLPWTMVKGVKCTSIFFWLAGWFWWVCFVVVLFWVCCCWLVAFSVCFGFFWHRLACLCWGPDAVGSLCDVAEIY